MNLESYREKNVLITGGLGFMGSNLAHKLVELGSDVTILDAMMDERYGANLHNVHEIMEAVRIMAGDINGEEVERLVKNKEVIFHLAGQVGHYDERDFPGYPAEATRVNSLGSLNLLRACLKNNSSARVIHAGSCFQYGDPKCVPVDENHPVDPKVPYSQSKQEAEDSHREFHEKHGLDTVMLRIANPYGPRSQMKHPNYSFVNWFIRQAMENETIGIFGDGEQEKDLFFIDDLVDVLLKLGIEPSAKGEIFNVGSGKGYTVKEVAEKVIQTVGSGSLRFEGFPEKYKLSGKMSYISDIEKVRDVTGWSPKVGLEEGLKRTVDFYKENKEHYW